MPKCYIARLSEAEQQSLKDWVSTGKNAADKIKHAHILLNIDANGFTYKLKADRALVSNVKNLLNAVESRPVL